MGGVSRRLIMAALPAILCLGMLGAAFGDALAANPATGSEDARVYSNVIKRGPGDVHLTFPFWPLNLSFPSQPDYFETLSKHPILRDPTIEQWQAADLSGRPFSEKALELFLLAKRRVEAHAMLSERPQPIRASRKSNDQSENAHDDALADSFRAIRLIDEGLELAPNAWFHLYRGIALARVRAFHLAADDLGRAERGFAAAKLTTPLSVARAVEALNRQWPAGLDGAYNYIPVVGTCPAVDGESQAPVTGTLDFCTLLFCSSAKDMDDARRHQTLVATLRQMTGQRPTDNGATSAEVAACTKAAAAFTHDAEWRVELWETILDYHTAAGDEPAILDAYLALRHELIALGRFPRANDILRAHVQRLRRAEMLPFAVLFDAMDPAVPEAELRERLAIYFDRTDTPDAFVNLKAGVARVTESWTDFVNRSKEAAESELEPDNPIRPSAVLELLLSFNEKGILGLFPLLGALGDADKYMEDRGRMAADMSSALNTLQRYGPSTFSITVKSMIAELPNTTLEADIDAFHAAMAGALGVLAAEPKVQGLIGSYSDIVARVPEFTPLPHELFRLSGHAMPPETIGRMVTAMLDGLVLGTLASGSEQQEIELLRRLTDVQLLEQAKAAAVVLKGVADGTRRNDAAALVAPARFFVSWAEVAFSGHYGDTYDELLDLVPRHQGVLLLQRVATAWDCALEAARKNKLGPSKASSKKAPTEFEQCLMPIYKEAAIAGVYATFRYALRGSRGRDEFADAVVNDIRAALIGRPERNWGDIQKSVSDGVASALRKQLRQPLFANLSAADRGHAYRGAFVIAAALAPASPIKDEVVALERGDHREKRGFIDEITDIASLRWAATRPVPTRPVQNKSKGVEYDPRQFMGMNTFISHFFVVMDEKVYGHLSPVELQSWLDVLRETKFAGVGCALDLALFSVLTRDETENAISYDRKLVIARNIRGTECVLRVSYPLRPDLSRLIREIEPVIESHAGTEFGAAIAFNDLPDNQNKSGRAEPVGALEVYGPAGSDLWLSSFVVKSAAHAKRWGDVARILSGDPEEWREHSVSEFDGSFRFLGFESVQALQAAFAEKDGRRLKAWIEFVGPTLLADTSMIAELRGAIGGMLLAAVADDEEDEVAQSASFAVRRAKTLTALADFVSRDKSLALYQRDYVKVMRDLVAMRMAQHSLLFEMACAQNEDDSCPTTKLRYYQAASRMKTSNDFKFLNELSAKRVKQLEKEKARSKG